MKRNGIIYKVLLALFFMGGLSSCEDVLDKTPDGRLTLDQVLKSYDQTKGLLSAAYTQFETTRDYLFFFQTLEALSDNAFEAREDGYSSYWWHSGQLQNGYAIVWPTPNGFGAGLDYQQSTWWGMYWKGVRLANVAIKNIPNSTAVNDVEKERWVNEARLLRAYYYFKLISLYGPLPFFEEPFTPDFMGWQSLTRPTFAEVADKIAAECDAVINSGALLTRYPGDEAARMSAGFAYALKSRVLLYSASPLNNPENEVTRWQKAAAAAKDVIDLSDYSLVSMANYKTLFTSAFATDVPEIIYRSYMDNNHIGNVNGIPMHGYGLASCFKAGEVPTQEMVDCFEMTNGALPVTYNNDTHLSVTINPNAAAVGYGEGVGDNPYANRDARFYENVVYNQANLGVPTGVNFSVTANTYVGGEMGVIDDVTKQTQFSNTGYYSWKGRTIKYYGPSGLGHTAHHHMVLFRLAEAYLNHAEALCEAGDLAGAMTSLNVIRQRANQPRIQDVPGFTNTREWLRERIRNERRVEFCQEDQRFFDQRRWKILDKTNKIVTGMRIERLDVGVFKYTRKPVYTRQSYTDKYLVLPILQDEAKKISGIGQPDAWK